jgi:hypothetical protein
VEAVSLGMVAEMAIRQTAGSHSGHFFPAAVSLVDRQRRPSVHHFRCASVMHISFLLCAGAEQPHFANSEKYPLVDVRAKQDIQQLFIGFRGGGEVGLGEGEASAGEDKGDAGRILPQLILYCVYSTSYIVSTLLALCLLYYHY